MYCQIIKDKIINIYESIPHRIVLSNGYTRTSLHELSVKEQEQLGLFYFEDIKPEYDTKTQYLSEPMYSFLNNKVLVQYKVLDKSPQQLESEAIQRKREQLTNIKKIRDFKIKQGYIFKGYTFYIDKDSQGDIFVAMLRAEKDPIFEIYWKTKEGWIFLNNLEIQQMAMEILVYVESLFAEEKNSAELIDPELIRTEAKPIINPDDLIETTKYIR